MIYLAPLQGFTDFVYRKNYNNIFGEINTYFIPYISVKNKDVLRKYQKEILPEHNPQEKVVPQVLVKDENELLFLSAYLAQFKYKEINLNLGCPYPMVTNRGKGAGLLPHPEKIEKMLEAFFHCSNMKLSIKMRAGLESPNEIEKIIPVLNDFPISEVILHPRIAKQLYKGEVNQPAFQYSSENLKHKLIYNGDIFSIEDFIAVKSVLRTEDVMLGRGVLMNLFLPYEILGKEFSDEERKKQLIVFHERMLDTYLQKLDNEGNVLNKMKQFWIYFSHNFPAERKVFKRIKKTKTFAKYSQEVQDIFDSI